MNAPQRPVALRVLPETIPEYLKAQAAWVLWRYKLTRKGKWSKEPFQIDGRVHASTTNRSTWTTFDNAFQAYECGKFHGIGIVLTDDLAGVDLDHVLIDGAAKPWAQDVLDRFAGAYVERSPGGDGLRIFSRGTVKKSGKGGPDNHLEVYGHDSPRYLTVTGDRISKADKIIEMQAALDWLHTEFMVRHDTDAFSTTATSTAADEEIIRRARKAANGQKFAALFDDGTGVDDASSNDLALCCLLAFWTRDPEQIDRIFRASKLMRPKWDEKRGSDTYGAMTIAKALETVTTWHTSAGGLIPKSLNDFYLYAPDNRCIYLSTAEMWACTSVDMAITEWPKNPQTGDAIKPSRWLARHRAIDQLTWHPGRPQVQEGVSVRDGGYIKDSKTRVFNLYRGPSSVVGDPSQAGPWLEHVHCIYPETADHITRWLAHRAQHPGEKINHALVLGGGQGIGKDTLLEPVKAAVGPWNWTEISPAQMLGRFNGWSKAVIVRVNEARDFGDTDRFAFYDHSKVYIAAPPDVIRVDEKNLREYQIFNVCGIVITSNHKTDGIYLAPDDRRHHVSWSDATRETFKEDYWRALWTWYAQGGIGHVVAYLRSLDLTAFDPKAPPERTRAFQIIVQANHSPEDSEIADLLDLVNNPPAVCMETLVVEAQRAKRYEVVELLTGKARRSLPHKMERCGYEPVRNPDADDGLFKVENRRRVIYAKKGMSLADQVRAARAIRSNPWIESRGDEHHQDRWR